MRFADFLDQLRPVLDEVSDTVLVFEHLPSTNAYARHLLETLPGDVAPASRFVLLAFEQTAGRGRRGRSWIGPPGGLYVSWVVPLDRDAPRSSLPLLSAASICEAVRASGVPACEVEWPNDLMVGGRKLGGILIEVVQPATGV
ncbi:MAG: biotin--[acetyl-CoA-carboxylase] ligase, partial [Thermoanaerobaculia bacterium]|nr:biotin--[acetyl-CoA-carboxylase] ligase [Thermoanaerobaculia bacterium]